MVVIENTYSFTLFKFIKKYILIYFPILTIFMYYVLKHVYF